MEEGQGQGREVEGRDSWVGSLAHIFHRAMMGVAAHVDAFLGQSIINLHNTHSVCTYNITDSNYSN